MPHWTQVSEPRSKPPFPVEVGLFGLPTVINNVETLANVPIILRKGGAAFAGTGTQESCGTKLFCVSGHVARPGLYEVPFGVTLGGFPSDSRVNIAHIHEGAATCVCPVVVNTQLTAGEVTVSNGLASFTKSNIPVTAEVAQSLIDIGYTVPGQAWTYWNMGPGPGPSYLDTDHKHDWSEKTGRTAASHLVAVAKALAANPIPAPPE